MDTFIYFSYGSNVLEARLKDRCKTAVPIGNAIAKNRTLEYTKLSKDGSGKATLRQADSHEWHGRLFRISIEELDALDSAEGKGYGYERYDDFEVHDLTSGRNRAVITYLASDPKEGLVPYDWYVGLVIAGYLQAGVPPTQIYDKQLHSYASDQERSRKSFLEAIEAIEEDGFLSIETVLRRLESPPTE